jgi:hypothetical protein
MLKFVAASNFFPVFRVTNENIILIVADRQKKTADCGGKIAVELLVRIFFGRNFRLASNFLSPPVI